MLKCERLNLHGRFPFLFSPGAKYDLAPPLKGENILVSQSNTLLSQWSLSVNQEQLYENPLSDPIMLIIPPPPLITLCRNCLSSA